MMLPAEELRTDLRRGMARLEHYLDRAAAERRVQGWERLAQAGLEAAMYEWESGALWLWERDAGAWREERDRAAAGYRGELEGAYVRWASERVYRERAGFEGSGLGAALREAAESWTYGDSGRVVDPAEAAGVRAAWAQVSAEIVDRCLADWEERQGGVLLELNDRFAGLGLSDREREALIREAAKDRRAELVREYQRIALAEENRLMARLFYDQGSTKRLAADEAAGVIARELAREAEAATEERTRELFGRLDTLISAEPEGGIELGVQDWLNQFRGAFEEALARWEEAELGFLAARAEWEHDAEDAYLAGEESWNRAYLELTERQRAWEAAILLQLDEGFAAWRENETRLAAEIESAREEFVAASEENRRVKEKLLESQEAIYVRSRLMLDMVRQGIESWFSLWDEKYLAVYLQMKNAIAQEKKDRTAAAADLKARMEEAEINGDSLLAKLLLALLAKPAPTPLADQFGDLDYGYFKNLFTGLDVDNLTDPYQNQAETLGTQLERWNGACLALMERGLWDDADFLKSMGALLDEGTGWLSLGMTYRGYADSSARRLYEMAGGLGDSYAGDRGELRSELVKAEALLHYWDGELEVAEALNSYAQETRSLIEGAAETRAELERAKAAYAAALDDYERTVGLINDKALLLDRARERLTETQGILAGLKAEAEEAQRDYQNLIAALGEFNPALVYADLTEQAAALLDFWENRPGPGDSAGAASPGDTILEYYRLSHEYADILRSLELEGLITALTTGSGLGQESIAELGAKAEEARRLAETGREEDLRAGAGSFPAGLSITFYRVLNGGEEPLAGEGRELLISLDQAYRESADSLEREALLSLMRQVWDEAAAYYAGEAALREESVRYLTTGFSREMDAESRAQAERIVYLRGLLAALRFTADHEEKAGESGAAGTAGGAPEDDRPQDDRAEDDAGHGGAGDEAPEAAGTGEEGAEESGEAPEPTLGDMADLIERILGDGSNLAAAVARAAGEIPLFARIIHGGLELSGPASVASWLAQREAARALGLEAVERGRLIRERYESYYAPGLNQKNQAARLRVQALMTARHSGTGDARGMDTALAYTAELRDAGEDLNLTGREALEDYIAAFLEYAAVCDYQYGIGSPARARSLEAEYAGALNTYRLYDSWQYQIYSPAGITGIRESAAFQELSPQDRRTFSLAEGDLSALGAWAGGLTERARRELSRLSDALLYARYYEGEQGGGRFSRLPDMAALRDDMLNSGVSEQTIHDAGPLMDTGAADYALTKLRDKALMIGSWFMREVPGDYTQYRAGLDPAAAESARRALEQGLRSYQAVIDTDARLVAALGQDIEKLRYLNENETTLKALGEEKHRIMVEAVTRFDTYANRDYVNAALALDRSCEDYNAAVDRADDSYRLVEAARLALRTRQEITDWAESVYLKNFGTNDAEIYVTPREKLSQVRYAQERARIAVEVLRELVAGREPRPDAGYQTVMDLYKESRRTLYLAQVAAYEGERALARQEAVVREAELAEQAARNKLVRGSGSVEADPYELVILTGNETTGYRPQLRYTLVDHSETVLMYSHDPDKGTSTVVYRGKRAVQNPGVSVDGAAFTKYFGDENGAVLDRLGTPKTMSLAEWEAGEWLKGMGERGSGYFDDVMLASLYIKYCAAPGSAEGEFWFRDESDPRWGGTYTMGDLPLGTSFTGLNLGAEYNSARRDVLKEAYDRVMGGGGEDDIARYLLYRNRNLITGNAAYEEELLKSRAFAKVDRTVEETHRNYTIAFGVAMGIGTAFLATAAGYRAGALFNTGLLILVYQAEYQAALAFASAGVLGHARDQINTIWKAVQGNRSSAEAAVDNRDTQFQREYGAWTESLDRLRAERETLNRMLYGTGEKPAAVGNGAPPLSYENFRGGLEALLTTGDEAIAISFGETMAVYSRSRYEQSGAREGSTVIGAMKVLNGFLDAGAQEGKAVLERKAGELKQEQNRNLERYQELMASALVIPQNRQAELRALALQAGDPSLDIAERQAASRDYERLIGELRGDTETTRREIRETLWRALGDYSWNSGYHITGLIGLEGELFGSRVLYNRPTEFYTEGEAALLREAALSAADLDSALKLSIHEREWDLKVRDFLTQYGAWQDQVEQIRQMGYSAWDKARGKLNEGYNTWRKNFGDEYQAKTGAWDLGYLEFVNQKQGWVEEQYLYAVNRGNAELFEYTGLDSGPVIAQALAGLSVERMNRERLDPGEYTAALLESSILGDLLARVDALGDRAGTGAPRVQIAARRTSAAESLARAAAAIGRMDEDIQQGAARLAAQDARRIIDELVRGLQDRLDGENGAIWEWEEHLVQLNGYRTDGEIRRTAVVDSTLFEKITRKQTIHRYRYFDPDAPDPGVDLSAAALDGLDAGTIMRMIDSAGRNLDHWGQRIFGRVENGVVVKHQNLRGIDDVPEDQAYVTVRDGELGNHIGYGPVLKDSVDYRHRPRDDALDPGAGEMGKILLDLMWNSRVSSMGQWEAGKAVYDQKFWAGELIPGLSGIGLEIQAPTLRDAVGLGAAAGSLIHPALGFVDDALFAAFDLGIGYRSTADVAASLALGAVTSAVSAGSAALPASGLLKNLGAKGMERLAGILGKEAADAASGALGAAAASYTTSAAVNAVRAYDFRTGVFDYKGFAGSLYSAETFSGVLSSLVGAGLGSLTNGALSQVNQKLYGGLVTMTVAGYQEAARYGVYAAERMIHGSGDMISRLGQAYDSMGGITLNIANLGAMLDMAGTLAYRLNEDYDTALGALGGRFAGTGLVELTLGLDGASLALGMGGIDAGGTLYRGLKHGLDYAALRYGSYGDSEHRDLLIAHYLYGDWAAENTSRRIEAERDRLRVDGDGNLLDRGAYGHTTRLAGGTGRLITIADTGSVNANAIVLQHESHRNGYVTAGNGAETIAAVLAHTTMADRMLQDGQVLRAGSTELASLLARDLLQYYSPGAGMADFSQYALTNYESDGDYWLIKMNGDIVGTPNDPRIYREIYNQKGELVIELVPGSNESGSQAASLVALLGEKRVRELLSVPGENGIKFLDLDYQAIREILGEGATIPGNFRDEFFPLLDHLTQHRILGESLLRKNGYTWNEREGLWEGSALNIASVPTDGHVGIVKKGNVYIPFTVTSWLYRKTDGFKQYVYQDDKWNEDPAYRNNTVATYMYTDLRTGERSGYTFQGPLNFVDILDGSDAKKGGANQAYDHPVYGTIQGATVALPTMNQRIVSQSSYGEVLLFTDFTDLKGDFFGKNGMRKGLTNDPRTLYHWTVNGYSDSCLVSFSVKGGLSGAEYFRMNMDHLKKVFSLYEGMEIKTQLYQY
jgi:hypothetical protein